MNWDVSWTSAVLGQAAASSDSAAPSASVQIQSVWDFAVKGGPVMIPIALCSLIALTVVIERLITLRRRQVIPPGFVPGLRAILDRGGRDVSAALTYCQSHAGPLANIMSAGLKKLSAGRELLEKAVAEAGQREVAQLRKRLRLLSVIVAVSPLLGLLGTILGMINAFETVAASGEALGRTELLAKGIYEAMITTAAGLLVTIPVLICYHWICAKIDELVNEMDLQTIELFDALTSPATAAARLPEVAARAGHARTTENLDPTSQPEAADVAASVVALA